VALFILSANGSGSLTLIHIHAGSLGAHFKALLANDLLAVALVVVEYEALLAPLLYALVAARHVGAREALGAVVDVEKALVDVFAFLGEGVDAVSCAAWLLSDASVRAWVVLAAHATHTGVFVREAFIYVCKYNV